MAGTVSQKIAFLGMGLMGAPMAANLLKAGHRVTVWNRSPEKCAPLIEQGATLAEDPAQAAAGAEAIVTMVTDSSAVANLLFERGLLEAIGKGALFVDCSSIDPTTARHHAQAMAKRGITAVDAPVSGGPSGAEQATLAIMAGGTAEAFERARPLLEALGRPTHVGPAGAGQLAKLTNQVIVALAIGAVAEGLLLAHSGGANAAAVRKAMTGGFADSLILQIHGERMLERRFLPGGAAGLHLKDLRNALAEAKAAGLDLPLAGLACELFEKLVAEHGKGVDHSGLLLEIERRNRPARLGDKTDELPN